jgi:hypothetical protein
MYFKFNRFLILIFFLLLPVYARADGPEAIFGGTVALGVSFIIWVILLFVFFKFVNLLVSNIWRALIGILGFLLISYAMIHVLIFFMDYYTRRS